MVLPWDVFDQTIDKIYNGAARRGYRLVRGITSSDSIKAIHESRNEGTHKGYGGPGSQIACSNNRLSQLIYLFRFNVCTDPRDRVFGLLGLMDQAEQVEVDYDVSHLRLYIHVLAKPNLPGKHPYKNIYFRDERYLGHFARTLPHGGRSFICGRRQGGVYVFTQILARHYITLSMVVFFLRTTRMDERTGLGPSQQD